MALEEFLTSLRTAYRMLSPPTIISDISPKADSATRSDLHSADFWLTPRSVAGFDIADFSDWPEKERTDLATEVESFKAIAEAISGERLLPAKQRRQAPVHLRRVFQIVGERYLDKWLDAPRRMMAEASAAAESKRWYVEQSHKEINESLLGKYDAPRLRVKSLDHEVFLNPIAFYGSGRQGVVDLVAMPTYETACYINYRDGDWQIVPRQGASRRRFTGDAFVKTVGQLPPR